MEEKIFGSYTSWKVEEHTWFITTGNGSMYLYLIEGDERALLIDTAYGFGNLRAYVEGLTDKPILVANTHGHLDHVGGNGWWEEIHMHPDAEVDMATLEGGPFDVSTLPHPNYRRVPISEGYVFDLGGRRVEVIGLGAHAPSGVVFLDSRGYLFCGDELESAQVLLINYADTYKPLEARAAQHLAGMRKIEARLDEVRYICPAHNGAPISKEYVYDFIELDKQIQAGTHTLCGSLEHFFIEQRPDAASLRRTRYKGASFIYRV